MSTKNKLGIVASVIIVILLLGANIPNYLRLTENGECAIGVVQSIAPGSYGRKYAKYMFQLDGKEFFGETSSPGREELIGRTFVVVYVADDPGFSRMQFEYEVPVESFEAGNRKVDCEAVVAEIDYWGM